MTDAPNQGEEACDICGFWAALRRGGDRGVCRRMPPVPLAGMALRRDWADLPGEEDALQRSAVWPETHHEDWCGEFRKAHDVV